MEVHSEQQQDSYNKQALSETSKPSVASYQYGHEQHPQQFQLQQAMTPLLSFPAYQILQKQSLPVQDHLQHSLPRKPLKNRARKPLPSRPDQSSVEQKAPSVPS